MLEALIILFYVPVRGHGLCENGVALWVPMLQARVKVT